MIVRRVELADFRNYSAATFELDAGLTAVVGDNGQGKTNLAEALAYLATLHSFRRAPPDAQVRVGATQAIIRAEVEHDDGRVILVEVEINRVGRNRVMINKQRLAKTRELLGVMRVTVFAPDDLALIKDGPGERRTFLDDLLVALHPRHDAVLGDLERILRQRNVLLKQAGGRLSGDIGFTLDVWDAKLAATGETLGRAREALVHDLEPLVGQAYRELSGVERSSVGIVYDPPWRRTGLVEALATGRLDDVRRQLSLIGPHRDEVELAINAMAARTHASQGEQRTLALALRLAGHRLVADRVGTPPVLVLDDVLSELDPIRCAALLAHLPTGQVVLTTAGVLPDAAHPTQIIRIASGTVSP